MIELCFGTEELMIYVRNMIEQEKTGDFAEYADSLLKSDNLQKLFIRKMKDAKKSGTKKSQVGLITIMKDRGAKLAWKIEHGAETDQITTLARISLKGKDAK